MWRPTPLNRSSELETIMLVEDDDSVRELSRSVLEMNGYTVLGADRGAQALEAFGPLARRSIW